MVVGLYQLILWLALPLVWLRLQWRARSEAAYGARVGERFGRVPAQVPSNCIWFHTVSAGETIAAAPLIRQLAEEFAPAPFLVTTMTPTGSQQVTARLSDCVAHCYAPYDFGFAVSRFFDQVQPRLLVLMETELWPNLIATAHRRGIPVLLVNARLSERSAKGYARVQGLTRPMLARLSGIACQSEAHAERFAAIGADPATIQVLGSVKYDVTEPAGFAEDVAALRRVFAIAEQPVWIAASTHPGEDEIVLEAFRLVREQHPDCCLLLVPRHPVRADNVCALAANAGFSVSRHSARIASSDGAKATDVIVGDLMGTLLTLYGLADVAFVGGSFVEVGGHNPLEPALCQVPVVSGPYQFNFTDVMADLEQRGGLRTVADAAQLAEVVTAWLGDTSSRQHAGASAAAALAENRGAMERVCELLRGWIRTVLLH